jgi:hypothetical protein
VLEQRAPLRFPEARVVPVAPDAFVAGTWDWDAFLVTESFARAWAELHPEFLAVVPAGLSVRLPLSYMVRGEAHQFLHSVNSFLEIKRGEGFFERQADHWVIGRPPADDRPRWCLGRDVLRWLP